MKYIYLLTLCTVLSFSLKGQDDRMRANLEIWTYPALKTVISQACDSMRLQQKRRVASKVLAKSLVGKNNTARIVFGKCDESFYQTAFSPDTAQTLIAASRMNKRGRTMVNRWSFVLARANALRSKAGTQELYRKYGDKLLTTLRDPKEREALINREVLIYAMFFNEWVDRTNDFADNVYCGQVQKQSNSKLDDIKSLKVRGATDSQEEVSAGGSLDPENILFSYPGNGQMNFYPLEYIREYGMIKFKNYCCQGMREVSRSNKLWLKWTSSKGQTLFTRVLLRQDEVAYQIPSYFLKSGELYRMELVSANTDIFDSFLSFYGKRELATLIEKGVYHLEKKPLKLEEVFFTAYFRVSKHGMVLAKNWDTKFYPSPGEKDVYLMPIKGEYGADEIAGIDGSKGMLRMNVKDDRSLNSTLDKMYGRSTGLYLNHPSQEYVDYLKQYKDSLNVDSLIAIEFMPMKERSKKYRRLRYSTKSGKKKSPNNFGAWLSERPDFRNAYTVQANTRRVTQQDFEKPTSFQFGGDTIRIEVDFAERVVKVYDEFVPLVEARKEEYANLLRQLNELASRPVVSGSDYQKIVAELNPGYLTNYQSFNLASEPRKAGDFVTYSYGWPMGTIVTTQGGIPLRVD